MTTAYFENIKPRILEQLLTAKDSVKVISAYFSDKDLFDMLCLLSNRGVKVELIIADEPMNTFESKIKFSDFIDSNGRLYLANRNPVQTLVHHKFCLIDESVLMTGSFNWTTKASMNRENLIITDDKETASKYLLEFDFVKEEYSKEFSAWDEVVVPSGFSGLDQIINTFKPSELICLTGESGMGKTNLILNMLMKISGEFKIPVGYISSEISAKNLSLKLLSLASKVQFHKLRTGKLEDYEWNEIHKAEEQIKDNEFFFQEGGIRLNELEKKCKMLWYKGVKFIAIDSIDYLLSNHGKDMDNEQNRDVMGRLKNLARLLRIPIILVSEINVNNKKYSFTQSSRPILSNLGIVSYYVDSVISIHREDYYGILEDESGESLKGRAEVSVQKHISGATGIAYLKYNSIIGNFESLKDTSVEVDPGIIKKEKRNRNEGDVPF